MNRLIITVCGIAFSVAPLLEAFASENPETDTDLKSRIERAVAQIRTGDLSKNAALRVMGQEAIPFLLEYAKDENADVRMIIAMALGETLDPRAIPVLVDALGDVDGNVSRTAISHLCLYPLERLKEHSSERMLVALTAYAGRWSGESYRAVLLVGHLGGKSNIERLHKILRQAGDIAGPMDAYARAHLVSRMRDACLKALFKLGDKTTTEKVRISFTRSDVPSIVFAVEAVAYAGKKEYMKDLIRLLDDGRDAVRPSPGWPSYLRVRDIAINAIVQLSGIKPSFPLRNLTRYTDDEVMEVKKLTRDAKTD